MIDDAVATGNEFHGLGEVYLIYHEITWQRGPAACLSTSCFCIGSATQVLVEVLMERISVVLRFDEFLFHLYITDIPRVVLAPSKELHLVISTQSSIPAPGTSREVLVEVETATASIFEGDASPCAETDLSTSDKSIDFSSQCSIDISLSDETESKDMVL